MQADTARAHAKPGTEEVVLTMGGGGETFRFPIVADETDGPPDGAEVSLSVPAGFGSAPPPPKGKVVGRDLVIDHLTDRHINILATAADGSTAIVRILGDARKTKIGSDAKFRKPRALAVTAHDRKGDPLAGYLVQCRSPGNNPIGKEAAIGADGSARIDGLPAQRLDVTIRGTTENIWQARVAGVVDLTKPGDGTPRSRARARAPLRDARHRRRREAPAADDLGAHGRGARRHDGGRHRTARRGSGRGDPALQLPPGSEAEGRQAERLRKGLPFRDGAVTASSDEDAIIELEAALVTGATIRIHVVPPADNVHDVGVEVYDDAYVFVDAARVPRPGRRRDREEADRARVRRPARGALPRSRRDDRARRASRRTSRRAQAPI